MGFFKTAALMIVGYIAMKTIKRAMRNIEAQLVKAKVNEQKPTEAEIKSLKLDPVTGTYRPEA